MSSQPELAMWLHDTGQQIPCFDSCQLINMDAQYQRCIYGKGATLLIFKVWGLTYGVWTYRRMDSHVTTKFF